MSNIIMGITDGDFVKDKRGIVKVTNINLAIFCGVTPVTITVWKKSTNEVVKRRYSVLLKAFKDAVHEGKINSIRKKVEA